MEGHLTNLLTGTQQIGCFLRRILIMMICRLRAKSQHPSLVIPAYICILPAVFQTGSRTGCTGICEYLRTASVSERGFIPVAGVSKLNTITVVLLLTVMIVQFTQNSFSASIDHRGAERAHDVFGHFVFFFSFIKLQTIFAHVHIAVMMKM